MEREEERLRIVIDTNILIGALVRDTSFKARLLKNKRVMFFFPDYGLIRDRKISGIYLFQERKRYHGAIV